VGSCVNDYDPPVLSGRWTMRIVAVRDGVQTAPIVRSLVLSR